MDSSRHWFLVCYDIREPRRLQRVARHLKGYGQRVQYSVFRCRLNARQLERLKWELTALVAIEDDMMYIGLCDRCVSRIGDHNPSQDWPVEPPTHQIV
ncbi:MAG TPA: CRISPR-associated endonuclease Cas2 [Phycisphaerae bacterium]|nr:CRISPR-associated endonuclease Cas2 [Phycisphaerae bacterium]